MQEEVLQYVYALMEDTEGTAFGSYWQKTLQPHIHRKTEVASSIEEARYILSLNASRTRVSALVQY